MYTVQIYFSALFTSKLLWRLFIWRDPLCSRKINLGLNFKPWSKKINTSSERGGRGRAGEPKHRLLCARVLDVVPWKYFHFCRRLFFRRNNGTTIRMNHENKGRRFLSYSRSVCFLVTLFRENSLNFRRGPLAPRNDIAMCAVAVSLPLCNATVLRSKI